MKISLIKFVFSAALLSLLIGCSKDQTTILQADGTGDKNSENVIPDTGSGDSDGVSSGGGGDVVVCYNARNEVIDMESYDIWTGPMHSRLSFARLPVGENDNSKDDAELYMNFVNDVLDNLGKFDPVFAERLKKIAAEFSPEEIARGETINMVPALALNGDSHAVVIPEATDKCHRLLHERMFWQVDKPRPHQYKYQLVERLWKNAPSAVRAAVITHESIWKVERELFNPTTSANSQYFNAVISSKEFRNYTVENYLTLISELQYPITDGPGNDTSADLPVDAMTDDPDGQADLGVLVDATPTWASNEAFSISYKGAVFVAYTVYFGTAEDNYEISGELAYPQMLGAEGSKKEYTGYVTFRRDGKIE